MRNLNKAQKRALDKAFEEGATDIDSLSLEDCDRIVKMNDHETVMHNIVRYLTDKFFEAQRNRPAW